jgi:hypothetical protein
LETSTFELKTRKTMKPFLTIVWSIAALAIFASPPVLGSPQKQLRGGKPLEQQHFTAAENYVLATTRRQHRVLERLAGGRPSVVEGKLRKLGVNPKKAGTE